MRMPTKAAGNSYCKARLDCSKFNDTLRSREGAAEITGIDRTRLAHIELGTATPYPDEVMLMADAYNAPELLNYHCSNECPIGKVAMPCADVCTIEQIAVRMSSLVKDLKEVNDVMIDIAKDGVVHENEKMPLKNIKDILEKSTKLNEELRIYMEKGGLTDG